MTDLAIITLCGALVLCAVAYEFLVNWLLLSLASFLMEPFEQ